MNNKNKLSLFPQNHETDIICRHKKDVSEMDINAVISYQGSARGDTHQGILHTDDANKALCKADGLVLCDNIHKFEKKAYLNRLNDAKNLKKTVYTSSYLFDWLGKDAFDGNDVIILNEDCEKRIYMMKSLLDISCPVISILGMGENCDKFSTLLSMRNCFEEEGYRVLAISGNPIAKLLGCEALPSYMYKSDVSSTAKTIKINHYIHELVATRKPDILIISHAGGIANLNEYENNYFGEISHILANAIASDYGVLCTYCNEYCSNEYYEYLKTICKIRFGIDILRFLVSKQNWKVDTEWRRTDYLFYSNEYFKKNIMKKLYIGDEVLIQGKDEGIKSLSYEIINLFVSNIEML